MSRQIDVTENELHVQNLVPSLDKLQEYGEKSKGVRDTIKEANKVFRPDSDSISKFPCYL